MIGRVGCNSTRFLVCYLSVNCSCRSLSVLSRSRCCFSCASSIRAVSESPWGGGPSIEMGRLIYIILLGYRHLAYSSRFSSTKGSLTCAAKMHTGLPRFIRSIRKTCNQLWNSGGLPFSSVLQSFGCECAMSGDCLSDYSRGGSRGVLCGEVMLCRSLLISWNLHPLICT